MAGEFALIDRYFARPTPQAVLGPGDDCALIAPRAGCELAITTDMLVEGTHFLPGTDPEALGWKTLAVNLSDLAAMGAVPRWVLLAGSLPKADPVWLEGFARGFFALATEYGVDLIGGDTTRGPLNLCVTAMGEVPCGTALRRDGAQPGDDLWVSGRPGLAALGLADLQGTLSLPEELRVICWQALHRPQPRLALGQFLRGLATAAIDVSDGLLADLNHILRRSHCAVDVPLAALPALPLGVDTEKARQAQLAGGDDYELIFTAAPVQRHLIENFAKLSALPLTRIGSLRVEQAGEHSLRVFDVSGAPFHLDRLGYDHFA